MSSSSVFFPGSISMEPLIAPFRALVPAWLGALPSVVFYPLVFVGAIAAIIGVNVAQQLLLPRDKSLPPVVFHYIPWFGSAASYGMDPYKFWEDCRAKYGDVFTFVMMGRRMTCALGPKGNNVSLGGKASQVSAEAAYTHLTTPVFGAGVVYDCPNDMLMQQKKFIKHGLTTEALQSYAPLIYAEVKHFFEHDLGLTKASPGPKKYELLNKMAELTIFSAGRTLQGKEVRAAMDAKFARWMEDLDKGFTGLNFLFPNLPLPSYKRRDAAQRAMSNFYLDIMRRRREGEGGEEHDMIAALQGSEYRDGTPLTDRDIAHMMIAILMAGQHTSAATSTWTLLHMSHRPDVQKELYEEQRKVFGQPDGSFSPVTYESTKELPIMDSCIRETLRMHAPLHSLYRKVMSDLTIPPTVGAPGENTAYVVPKGYYVVGAPGVSAMDKTLWAQPETWTPQRWLETGGEAAAAKEKYSTGDMIDYGFGMVSKGTESPYQPFGAGRHRCVGEQFAYLQLSTILSYIIRNFTMKLETPTFPKPDYSSMIVLPDHGIMSFTRRPNSE